MADELKPVLDAIAELKRGTDGRFDDMKRHVEVVAEQTRSDVRLIAERVDSLDRRMTQEFAAARDEMRTGFAEIKSAVKFDF